MTLGRCSLTVIESESAHPEDAQQPPPTPTVTRADIRGAYDTYHLGYQDPSQTVTDHLARARNLAYLLLLRYYPSREHFAVEPHSFSLMAPPGQGWSIAESNVKKEKNAKKEREKRAEQGLEEEEDEMPEAWKAYDPFHFIPSEHISGFVVNAAYNQNDQDGKDTTKSEPHTYLTIMVDDLKSMPNWISESNRTALMRADIMSYYLGYRASIDTGYGILIFGTRIEFYTYTNQNEHEKMKPFGTDWVFDMNTADFDKFLDKFEKVAMSHIRYQNGVLGIGLKVPISPRSDKS